MTYIKKHWRGEFSLAQSFWVNYIGLMIGLLLVGAVIIGITFWLAPIKLLFQVFFITTIIMIPLSYAMGVWQIVGVWRARNNHSKGTFVKFWALTCQLLVLFSAFYTVYSIPSNFRKMSSMYQTFYDGAFGGKLNGLFESDKKLYKFEILEDGQSLHIMGWIQPGLSKELKQLLKTNPHIKTLVLTSGGGSIREAHAIIKIVLSEGLNTHVPFVCASACTDVFLAGEERSMAKTAKLGFHNGTVNQEIMDKNTNDFLNQVRSYENAKFLALCKKKHISKHFIDDLNAHLNEKSGDDLWLPTPKYLLDLDVIQTISAKYVDIKLDIQWLEETEKSFKTDA